VVCQPCVATDSDLLASAEARIARLEAGTPTEADVLGLLDWAEEYGWHEWSADLADSAQLAEIATDIAHSYWDSCGEWNTEEENAELEAQHDRWAEIAGFFYEGDMRRLTEDEWARLDEEAEDYEEYEEYEDEE
jgi:hypothetical protein